MHRIDTPTAQTDKFGAGKNGFTRGNPQTGVPATALDDDYFDAIQEEIARVIEITGAVLNKNNRAQLLAAINTLIANGGTDFLKKTNNLSEIKDAGPTAVAQTLTNLGLGDAAQRTVGTGSENVPDISIADARYKPSSYVPPLSQVWLSSEYTPVLNTPIIVNHGLTLTNPLKCKADVILKCIVANNGYAVGETAMGLALWVQSTTFLPPIPLLTSTQIQINSGSQGSSGLLMGQRSAGGIATSVDPTQWRIIFRIIY
ncbi:bacteriophage tail fiber protein [Yersinia intermedia]|uniref:hypothetical protein n=1 Tax=Yersinia intermedia TaxID=631 RepID=UPI0005E976EB|nr:hypothetical protein [Yersinia intermedia]CQJ56555.1 bacteriophage tail fiber protein [Yersinia intermedia]